MVISSRYERLNSWLRGDVGSGNVKEESELRTSPRKKIDRMIDVGEEGN